MKIQEVMEKARSYIKNLLIKCAENATTPSLEEAWFAGYNQAMNEKDTIERDGWHYIELEGLPPLDKYGETDRMYVLYRYDGDFLMTEFGCYRNNHWILDFKPSSFDRVIAWHELPIIPE